jgi:NADPH:quinone reductase-like Zn-dependent oxidoreductase
MKGYHSILAYRRALRPGGKFIMVGGSWGNIFKVFLLGSLTSMFGSKKMKILILKPNRDLGSLIELFEAGTLVPVIDRRYPLSEVSEALRYIQEGRVKGKVVITVAHNNKPNKGTTQDN